MKKEGKGYSKIDREEIQDTRKRRLPREKPAVRIHERVKQLIIQRITKVDEWKWLGFKDWVGSSSGSAVGGDSIEEEEEGKTWR